MESSLTVPFPLPLHWILHQNHLIFFLWKRSLNHVPHFPVSLSPSWSMVITHFMPRLLQEPFDYSLSPSLLPFIRTCQNHQTSFQRTVFSGIQIAYLLPTQSGWLQRHQSTSLTHHFKGQRTEKKSDLQMSSQKEYPICWKDHFDNFLRVEMIYPKD